LAREFHALRGEVPIRITPVHEVFSPEFPPYAASRLGVPSELPTDDQVSGAVPQLISIADRFREFFGNEFFGNNE
jgi:hypothetical protein